MPRTSPARKPARSLARARARKAARKLPRSYRYQNAPQPPDGPILKYRLAMRWLVAKWWAKVGKQALAAAERIGSKHTDEESDEADAADAAISDYAYVADEPAFTARVSSAANSVEKHSDAQFKRIGIKLSKSDPGVSKLVPGFRKENVGLVKTMFEREKSKLEQLLTDGAGRRVESLARDIQDRFDITTRHAELIARDQCLKLNSKITHERAARAGIERAVWTTAGDSRVRDGHELLDNFEFALDDPPTPEGEDEPALPGEPINCRCISFFLLPELDDSADSEDDTAEAAE